MATEISAILHESKCASPTGCQFVGPDSQLYWRDDLKQCGRCCDRLDDLDMPYIVNEYTWTVLRGLERAS